MLTKLIVVIIWIICVCVYIYVCIYICTHTQHNDYNHYAVHLKLICYMLLHLNKTEKYIYTSTIHN